MTTHLSEADFVQISGTPAPILKRSKYRAVPVIVTEAGELYEAKAAKANGITGQRFDSKAEAAHWVILKAKADHGLIWDLERQPRYVLHAVNGAKVGTYVADFRHRDTSGVVVTEVKGFPTPLWKLKRKLAEAQYGVRIVEVRA